MGECVRLWVAEVEVDLVGWVWACQGGQKRRGGGSVGKRAREEAACLAMVVVVGGKGGGSCAARCRVVCVVSSRPWPGGGAEGGAAPSHTPPKLQPTQEEGRKNDVGRGWPTHGRPGRCSNPTRRPPPKRVARHGPRGTHIRTQTGGGGRAVLNRGGTRTHKKDNGLGLGLGRAFRSSSSPLAQAGFGRVQ